MISPFFFRFEALWKTIISKAEPCTRIGHFFWISPKYRHVWEKLAVNTVYTLSKDRWVVTTVTWYTFYCKAISAF